VEGTASTTAAERNARANCAGTGGGAAAADLRAAIRSLAGIWAGRAAGCRAAQSHFSSFFGFFGSTLAILTSPGAGIDSENPKLGGRRSECAFSKDKNGGFMASQAPLPLQQTLASEMTLFELDESLSILMESATDEAANNNGEIPEELRQALLDYCEAFGAKVDNIANYIKSQEFDARNAKAEIDRLQSRQAAAENKVERLKGLLKYFMETRGLLRMKGRLNTISLRKNSQDSLIVDSVDRIPSEYCRVSITFPVPELEELLRYLPEEHSLRARLTPNHDGFVRREVDNAKLRTALASSIPVPGAELRRGQHVRLT
jgi:hypothetical protein